LNKVEKFFLSINLVWLLIYGAVFAEHLVNTGYSAWHLTIAHGLTVTTLMLACAMLLLRIPGLLKALPVMIYSALLAEGFLIMLSVQKLFTLFGVAALIGTILFIFCMVGFRGYLKSNDARLYLGLETVPESEDQK